MTYEYELFLSYATKHHSVGWLMNHFLPLFKSLLEDALFIEEVRIFVDDKSIRTGSTWPLSLKRALARSRCLLGIWSPKYFMSEWCRRECAVFLYREKQLGYRTLLNTGGLIIPVIVSDGSNFPDTLRQTQFKEFNDYVSSGDAFRRTEKYIEFETQMRDWIINMVAPVVTNAPPECAEEWLSSQWLDDCIGLFDLSLKPVFESPTL